MLMAIYVFLIIFLIAFYYVAPTNMSKPIMSGLLSAVLFVIVLFTFHKEKVSI